MFVFFLFFFFSIWDIRRPGPLALFSALVDNDNGFYRCSKPQNDYFFGENKGENPYFFARNYRALSANPSSSRSTDRNTSPPTPSFPTRMTSYNKRRRNNSGKKWNKVLTKRPAGGQYRSSGRRFAAFSRYFVNSNGFLLVRLKFMYHFEYGSGRYKVTIFLNFLFFFEHSYNRADIAR